jgi:hypothetical protein
VPFVLLSIVLFIRCHHSLIHPRRFDGVQIHHARQRARVRNAGKFLRSIEQKPDIPWLADGHEILWRQNGHCQTQLPQSGLGRLLDLSSVEVEQDGRRALLRTAPRPSIDPICRAIGLTLPPAYQELPAIKTAQDPA